LQAELLGTDEDTKSFRDLISKKLDKAGSGMRKLQFDLDDFKNLEIDYSKEV
jgi:hypothetical protein